MAKKVLTKQALLLLLSHILYNYSNIEYSRIVEELERVGDKLYLKYLERRVE